MKKITAMLFVFLLLFCTFSSASSEYLEKYYACFFDGHYLSQLTGMHLSLDTFFVELFFTNNTDVVYYAQKKWEDGRLVQTDLVAADYTERGQNFTLTLPDGTVFSGRWENDYSTLWIDFGAGYYKFRPVERLNAFTEWKK